ncbi:3-deoxy-manno-octulosonate cytidylyltransferase [Agaribacter flavus]|uniref:3-deoxy-manno-octulosonate cytidylyltransferase n=1 Tax=Agaribacter flavus TaxID=1902781 RepID=A0ABV7FN13_9ALTE
MSFIVVIPARYASTRFPGKPLAKINGRPMLAHVYERAQASGAKRVIIATDDERIATLVKDIGAELCMTSEHHTSGTTRISEVIETCAIADDEIVVNVQGDEPFIPSENIQQVAENLARYADYPMATLCFPITCDEDLFNPNVVKVVQNTNGSALYFSRSPIPYPQGFVQNHGLSKPLAALPTSYYRHIGIYAYRAGFVKQYVLLPSSSLETTESLEQLRVLENGHSIHVETSKAAPPHGVDTPEDLARLQ